MSHFKKVMTWEVHKLSRRPVATISIVTSVYAAIIMVSTILKQKLFDVSMCVKS